MKSDDQRGPKTPRFDFRPSIRGFPEWQGIVREPGDPVSIPNNALWDAINIRFHGGNMTSRGGQEQWNDDAEAGCIYGFHDFEGVGGGLAGPMLIGPRDPHTSASPSFFGPCRVIEDDATPYLKYATGDGSNYPFQKVLNQNTSTGGYEGTPSGEFALKCFFKANGKLYGTGDVPPAIYEITANNTELTTRKVLDLPAIVAHNVVRSEREVGTGYDTVSDVVYLTGLSNGALYRWSQTTGLTTDGTSLSSYRMVLFVYRENVWIASRNILKRRDSAGSFTNVSLPATTYNTFYPLCADVFQDAAYIGGANYDTPVVGTIDATIIKLDGTTTSVARAIAGGGDGVSYIELAFSKMYFTYNNIIGSFDGTTWTNALVSAVGDGGAEPARLLSLKFNGKDMLIGTYYGQASEFVDPGLVKTTGSDFTTRVTIARDDLNPLSPCAWGDMILMDTAS